MIGKSCKCTASVTYTSFLLHFLGFVWYSFGLYHDRNYYSIPQFMAFGGRFQYLTLITAYFTWIVSGMASVIDLIQITTNYLEDSKPTSEGYVESKSKLINIRDELISLWVFTLAVFVCFMYWVICAIDPDGMRPPDIVKVIPLFGWFNQFLHTVPLFYVIILISMINYEYSNLQRVIFSLITFTSGYISWMWYCATANGFWAYDFMGKLSNTEFCLFLIGCIGVVIAIYFAGRKYASLIWSEDKRDALLIEKEKKKY